jgi:hypothetical protein
LRGREEDGLDHGGFRRYMEMVCHRILDIGCQLRAEIWYIIAKLISIAGKVNVSKVVFVLEW